MAEVETPSAPFPSSRASTIRKLVAIVAGSAMFMGLKIALLLGLEHLNSLPVWLNYAVVTISISLIGWVYHSKVSFRQPLTRQTLRRYVEQAISLKLLDYVMVNALTYLLHTPPAFAVVVTSGFVFLTRVVVYMKYVFPSGPEKSASQSLVE